MKTLLLLVLTFILVFGTVYSIVPKKKTTNKSIDKLINQFKQKNMATKKQPSDNKQQPNKKTNKKLKKDDGVEPPDGGDGAADGGDAAADGGDAAAEGGEGDATEGGEGAGAGAPVEIEDVMLPPNELDITACN